MRNQKLQKFLKEQNALAVPVTYMILFMSLIAIISATYTFAVIKLNVKGVMLKTSLAKQNMEALDQAIYSITWKAGASKVVHMEDCGESFNVSPDARKLTINFTDSQSFSSIIFNCTIGKIYYSLTNSEYAYEYFVKGDSRAIINQSAYPMSQLYFSTDNSAKQLILCYRPFATAIFTGNSQDKPATLIRLYVINLNSSQSIQLREKFYLKVEAINVTTISYSYEFNTSISSLALRATLDNAATTIWLPITSTHEGAFVRLEIVVCQIKIQKIGG